jgi:protein tyrosine phosphatase (PTP) superfamily phosphohydrolase (DUF442 family)
MDAINTHQVFDWLWTSGQLSENDIARLPSLGIEAVVNLATPTSSNALAGEAELVATQGLPYFQIPVEWENPRLDQLDLFFSLLAALYGRRLWVHCAMNMRVSAFIYLYRTIILGEDGQKAAFPLSEVWQPNAAWQAFIDTALASHGGSQTGDRP